MLAADVLGPRKGKGKVGQSKRSLVEAGRELGEATAEQLLQVIESGACVDEHLADQLVVFMALAATQARTRVSSVVHCPTAEARSDQHLETAIHVAAACTGAVFELLPDEQLEVEVAGAGSARRHCRCSVLRCCPPADAQEG